MKKLTTADRLKEIMSKQGLKQVDILNMCKPYCEKLHCKIRKNDLSQYVSGKVQPGQDKLSVLGLALNVSEPWLMGYDVPMNDNPNDITSKSNKPEETYSLGIQKQSPPSSDIESDDLKKLYSLIGDLPPEYWDEAERYLTFLVESQKKKQQP